MIQNIFIFLIAYVSLILISLFIYKAYLFNLKMKCAYVIELKNSNPNVLVKTKTKIISKKIKRTGICKIDENEVEVVLKDELIDKIKKIFYNEKDDKYYIEPRSKNDKEFEINIESEKIEYIYKIKNRDITYIKSSNNNYKEKEIVMYKNLFENLIYFEDEIGDTEVITEVELINKIPRSLDKYFFGEKTLDSLYKVQEKNMFDIFKPAAIIIGTILSIIFVINIIF